MDRNSVDGASGQNMSSTESIVFDSKLMKTSTQEFAATWGGRSSLPDSGRLRRAHSWSGIQPEDSPSEVRILRERLVRTQTKLRPSAVRNLSRHQRLTLASLALVDFMSFCSMSIMAPFFPKEASEKGLSETMCGLVFSFYAVVMFLTSPLFGKYLPTIGAKFMFISGMFLAGSCNILFGTLIRVRNYNTFTALCFIVRGMEAVGASAYSTASYVFVVNAFPDSIGSVLGILETFVGLGMSVGPAIGGLLYSIGGFGLPFYSLGAVMILTVPLNFIWLADCDEYVTGSKSASIFRLFKIPSIIITGLVIVIVSNTWAFLDPTLEPHLRQFGLSTKQIGLIFMLFSSLYGIFSPIWGWVADRVHNHWCMMVWGLFLSTVGLLLLGPCPFIPYLPEGLWLDLVALSILGISVALTLLPTFQGVLTSSIYEGGCPEALATYSAVAGVWSCCYSLGEVTGPALGGALAETYGFPLSATLCASACFCMAVVTLTFFSLSESSKWVNSNASSSGSIPYSDTTWHSDFCKTQSAPECQRAETSPLLAQCSCQAKHGPHAPEGPSRQICIVHKKNKSGAASVANVLAYFLKFQYLTDMCIKIRLLKRSPDEYDREELYQNYLEANKKVGNFQKNIRNGAGQVEVNGPSNKNGFCLYVDKEDDSGTKDVVVKRNNTGVVTKLDVGEDRRLPDEMIRHNLQKVQFYEQSPTCFTNENIFDGCECRDGVTYVRGTVTMSSSGACEV